MSSSLALGMFLPPSSGVCDRQKLKPAAARLLDTRASKFSSHILSRPITVCSQLSKICLRCHMMTHGQSSVPQIQPPRSINQPPSPFTENTYADINIHISSISSILKLLHESMGGRLQRLASAGSNHVLLLSATALLLQPLPCIAAEPVAYPPSGEIVQLGAVVLPPIPTEFPPLPDLNLPDYKKLVLPNGLKVLLLEDHELGLVGGQILVKGGGIADPVDKVGLASVTGAVQRGGGTTSLPVDDLNARLESMAARIESGAGVSEMSVAFRCLREDLEEVFGMFTDVVLHPAMPEDKLDLVRRQLLGVLARRNDDPGGIASRELPKLLYGPTSPYARVPEAPGVKSMTPSDLLAFHSATYRPDEAVLGLWGDFDSTTAQNLILSSLGSWSAPPPLVPQPPPPLVNVEAGTSFSAPGLYLIDRPGLTQGYVRMAELGTRLDDPDVFALDVLNSELNGFGGKLFDEVRSREGLAYSVSGGWAPAMDHRGAFVAGGESRVTSVPQFVKVVQRVMKDIMTEPPTLEELSQAKDSSLNSFVFNFADSGAQLSRIMTYELFGIDQDYIFKYKRGIEETTGDDVLRVAKRHLHPDKQAILIVTDVDVIRSSLKDLGLPMFDVNIN